MCPARVYPPRDPRRRPQAEKPQETLPEWRGVLLIADKAHAKISRIAEVTCRPAPPVPLPERVQIDKEFKKLDHAQYQVCIGLPFFELHKVNFKYHPDSEWSKFLTFMLVNQRFATVTCEGWELYFQPPKDGPPDGFHSVRVHYRRQPEAQVMAKRVHLEEPEVIQGPEPTSMEVESQAVPKRRIDFTAKMSHQPKLKRLRGEGITVVSHGYHGLDNAGTIAPSSSQENHLHGMVLAKSVGDCVTDISYDICSKPLSHGIVTVAEKSKVAANEEQVAKSSSQAVSGVAFGKKGWMKKYIGEAAAPKPPSGGADSGAMKKPSGVLNETVPEMVVSREAAPGAAPAIEDRMENSSAAGPVCEASFSGEVEKPSEASVSAQGLFKKQVPRHPLTKLKNGAKVCSGNDMIAVWKSSLPKEKLKGVGVSLPTSYINGLQKESQVADKGKGVSNGVVDVSVKKHMRKSKRDGNIKKHIVHALPKVPYQFRVHLSNGGDMVASSKELMPKVSSSVNGAFQKRKCSEPEVKLQGVKEEEQKLTLSSSSLENSAEQKSLKVAVKLSGVTDAPCSSGKDFPKTSKFRAYSNGVRRSKPQEIKLKKSSSGGSSKDDKSTSSDAKERENGWRHWVHVIENILELMHLAEGRNATRVEVGVEGVQWHVKEKNVVTVTIGDNGEGMSSRDVEEFFALKVKDIPADNLILLTNTTTEQLVGFSCLNDFKCLSYSKYDCEDTTSHVKRWRKEKVLETIEALSPFSSKSIKSELAKLGTMGTRMIVYGYRDLVFKQPQQDVNEDNVGMSTLVQTNDENGDPSQFTNGIIVKKEKFIEILHMYTRAMFLQPQVLIKIQNIMVKESLGERLFSTGNQYLEVMDKKEIVLSLSFDEACSKSGIYGICLYHQNKLLKRHTFLKVGKMYQDANYGRGVVGVVDVTQLMDSGDERLASHGTHIDFKCNKHYNMLMNWLADKVHEYYGGREERNICNSPKMCLDQRELQVMKVDDDDDGIFLSELLKSTPCTIETDGEKNSDSDHAIEGEEYEVESILDVKLEEDEVKYYVKWVGYDTSESTWEPSSNLCNAPKKIQDFFHKFPAKRGEIIAKKEYVFEQEDNINEEEDESDEDEDEDESDEDESDEDEDEDESDEDEDEDKIEVDEIDY